MAARHAKSANSTRPIREVLLSREPVELHKILKFESMVSSGGEAKAVIAKGLVQVNGEVETQKRKKIVAGDVIEFKGERVVAKFEAAEPAPVITEPTEAPSNPPSDQSNKAGGS